MNIKCKMSPCMQWATNFTKLGNGKPIPVCQEHDGALRVQAETLGVSHATYAGARGVDLAQATNTPSDVVEGAPQCPVCGSCKVESLGRPSSTHPTGTYMFPFICRDSDTCEYETAFFIVVDLETCEVWTSEAEHIDL